eukprot:843904_1
MAQKQLSTKKCDQNERVIVNLKMDQLSPLSMRVKMRTEWAKIIKSYGQARGVDPQFLKFLYDGNNIAESLTVGEIVWDDDFNDADIKSYGQARGVDPQFLKFLYDGNNIAESLTVGEIVWDDDFNDA